MSKSMSRFEPTPARAPEECERHYTRVHVRMAQDLLRPMPGLISYHINRAVAQADVTGGFDQRPRAWRFVVVRFAPGAALAFTDEQNEMVAQDHVNCLYRLRHCEVDETILLDRLNGQPALAKFLIEADHAPGVDREEAWATFAELAARLGKVMSGAFGARRLILSRALNEVECEAVDVEGQRPIGLKPATSRLGYIEAYFDHRRWGEQALAPLAGEGWLRREVFAGANLLYVEEQAPLDMS